MTQDIEGRVIVSDAGTMPHSPLERGRVDDWDRMIAFAIGRPNRVDVNEIPFRPTAQAL